MTEKKNELLKLINKWLSSVSGRDSKIEHLHKALSAPTLASGSDDKLRELFYWCFDREYKVVDLVVEIGKLDSPTGDSYSNYYLDILCSWLEFDKESNEQTYFKDKVEPMVEQYIHTREVATNHEFFQKYMNWKKDPKLSPATFWPPKDRHVPENSDDVRLFIVISKVADGIYTYWACACYSTSDTPKIISYREEYPEKSIEIEINKLNFDLPAYITNTFPWHENTLRELGRIEIVSDVDLYFLLKPETWTCFCRNGEILGGEFPVTYRSFDKYNQYPLRNHEFPTLPNQFDMRLFLELESWGNYTQYNMREYWGVQCWAKPGQEDFYKMKDILRAVPVLFSFREESLRSEVMANSQKLKVIDAAFLVTLTDLRRSYPWPRDIILVWDDTKYRERIAENIREITWSTKGDTNDK